MSGYNDLHTQLILNDILLEVQAARDSYTTLLAKEQAQDSNIADSLILSNCTGDLDDISDGSTYARTLSSAISSGLVLLSQASGDLDDITDGSTYGKVLVTSLSAGQILLAQCSGDLDDIANGTSYGRVLLTDISAGHILLASCDGNLDNITDGSDYSKVLSTSISAGQIILARGVGTLPSSMTDATTTFYQDDDPVLLCDDCSSLSGWTVADNDDAESTQVEYDGRQCFKLDSGPNSAANDDYAGIYRDESPFGSYTTIRCVFNPVTLGTINDNDYFRIRAENGTIRLYIAVASNGLYVRNGTAWILASADAFSTGSWQTLEAVVDWTARTVSFYKVTSGVRTAIALDMSCSCEESSTDGRIYLYQYGYSTNNCITYIDDIRVANAQVFPKQGDGWVDTDSNNDTYCWTGTAWDITTDVTSILSSLSTAQETADGQIVGFYQDAEPATGMSFGDIWIDTDGHTPPNSNDIYRYEDDSGGSQGSLAWRSASTNAIGLVYLDAYTAQATADSKKIVYYQDGIPTANAAGDMWVDTDDNNTVYVAGCEGADQITAGEWEKAADITANNTAADILNLPATPSGTGLFCSTEYLGYYTSSAWTSFIKNDGTFQFRGDDNNQIVWNGATLTVTGSIVIKNASDVRTAINVADGADVTGDNTAAAITGQGALATQNSVDLSTGEVTNKSLANLDSAANSKLSGIAAGATVGANWTSNLTNIPATLGSVSAAGLYLTSTYLGYYDGTSPYSTDGWTAFIANDGDFGFAGDANNSFSWDGSSLALDTNGTFTIKSGGDLMLIGNDSNPGKIVFAGSSYNIEFYMNTAGTEFKIFPDTDENIDFFIGNVDSASMFDDIIIYAKDNAYLGAKRDGSHWTYLKLDADANDIDIHGNLLPVLNKTNDLGLHLYAWDDAWADDWNNEADFYFFDDKEDLEVIKNIKPRLDEQGNPIIEPETGHVLIDDTSLPAWMFCRSSKHKPELYDEKAGNLKYPEINIGDVLYSAKGNPWISNRVMFSLHNGAIRELTRRLEALEARSSGDSVTQGKG